MAGRSDRVGSMISVVALVLATALAGFVTTGRAANEADGPPSDAGRSAAAQAEHGSGGGQGGGHGQGSGHGQAGGNPQGSGGNAEVVGAADSDQSSSNHGGGSDGGAANDRGTSDASDQAASPGAEAARERGSDPKDGGSAQDLCVPDAKAEKNSDQSERKSGRDESEDGPDAGGSDQAETMGESREDKSARIHDLTPTLKVHRKDASNVLEWEPPVAEAPGGYQVWRSLSPFALLATVPSGETHFEDPGAPEHAKYKVTAFFEPTAVGGFVEDVEILAAAPEWTPEFYKTASIAVPVPELGMRIGQGFGLGAGFLLVVLGLAIGRHGLFIRGAPSLPPSEVSPRLVVRRLRSDEMVRFLELWEASGRPFPLDPSTMERWNEFRETPTPAF